MKQIRMVNELNAGRSFEQRAMQARRPWRWVGTRHAPLALVATGLLGLGAVGCDESPEVPAPVPGGGVTVPSQANLPGNFLISDQYNNRVIEVTKQREIAWQFGDGAFQAGATAVVAPNDAQRVGELTLISGTGAPAAAEPGCPDGCQDNRVLMVDLEGKIQFQYGQVGVAGAGANQLNAPVAATFEPNGYVLITDQGNQRVIEVSMVSHAILWQYGTTGVSGAGADQLNNPNSAELLDTGNILIADEGNNRVIEVGKDKMIKWSYGSPADTATLNAPAFASRLPSGNTLISDSANNRIVEVAPQKTPVFTYATTQRRGSVADPTPTRAVELTNGNILISDQNNDQVVLIDHSGHELFTIGQIGRPGYGPDELDGPYDAKVIGDYTGLTAPGMLTEPL